MEKRVIHVAHSPDSDDAFMFYPLVAKKIDTKGLEFKHILKDIESLNRDAKEGKWEVSAVSFHAYPYIADKYVVLPSGGSVGDGYGPIVVSKEPLETLKGKKIAIPGKWTTAYLTLKLFEPDFTPVEYYFEDILPAVVGGEVDAGLVIHEGQLTYKDFGLQKYVDLGGWWKEKYNLPLPLGCNVVRKDLGKELIDLLAQLMRESITYALTHKDDAMKYARKFARGLEQDPERSERFVSMYVNERTVDYGKEGREAVYLLLKLGREKGIIKAEIPEKIFSDEI
ncbi:MAG TPA: ABC transporter substrate-binding protein [Aquifex aeolicus]|uniref:1,4-dihydroxy-6-naphtoate synthase n=1 Tax=Aquifex aeolicus TaxID=63363 RepID=A0A9D0YPT8_AQUAO|nr:ABC transporter substrate-binding protein [Aquificales bacterium]HIP98703.1 ABC transporter substrate-binding protein [Aquifex aeolicus]HIQ25892.1 ABC transporter substrate-binding protein [Aquifex aeolicus]